VLVFAVNVEHPLEVSVQCPHHADPRHHRRAVEFDYQEQGLLVELLLDLWELLDVFGGVIQRNEMATAGQGNGFVEGAGPGHLRGSNEPGRVALVCRTVSLRALAAFIATHLGAELVERHRAEHGQSFVEHPERHPDRSLAALATDPPLTFGLELGDSSVVCHLALKRDHDVKIIP
jgi:hypothetical protein